MILYESGTFRPTPKERPLMTSHVFLAIFGLPTYLVLLYNVPFLGLSWTLLPTLISDVIKAEFLQEGILFCTQFSYLLLIKKLDFEKTKAT